MVVKKKKKKRLQVVMTSFHARLRMTSLIAWLLMKPVTTLKSKLLLIVLLLAAVPHCVGVWDDGRAGYLEKCKQHGSGMDRCNDVYTCDWQETPSICKLKEDETLCEKPFLSSSDPNTTVCVRCRKPPEYSPPEDECNLHIIIQNRKIYFDSVFAKSRLVRSMNYTNASCESCFAHFNQSQTIGVRVYQKEKKNKRYISGIVSLTFNPNGDESPHTKVAEDSTVPVIPMSTSSPRKPGVDNIEAEDNNTTLYIVVTLIVVILLAVLGSAAFFLMKRRKETGDHAAHDDSGEHESPGSNGAEVGKHRGRIASESSPPKKISPIKASPKKNTPKSGEPESPRSSIRGPRRVFVKYRRVSFAPDVVDNEVTHDDDDSDSSDESDDFADVDEDDDE